MKSFIHLYGPSLLASILLALIFYHAGDPEFISVDIAWSEYLKEIGFVFLFIFLMWQLIRISVRHWGLSWVQVLGITFVGIFAQQILGELIINWELDTLKFFTVDIPFGLVTASGIYTYYKGRIAPESINLPPSQVPKASLLLPSVKGKVQVEEAAIHLVQLDTHKTLIYTHKQDPIPVFISLQGIWDSLSNKEGFYKLNRRAFARKEAIEGYKCLHDKRLMVIVNGIEFVVSKNKAASFKRWLEGK